MSPWSVIMENQMSGKTKSCSVGDLKPKHPTEDWTLEPSSVGRAAMFINHPDNLADVDILIDHDLPPDTQGNPEVGMDTRYNLRKSVKAPA